MAIVPEGAICTKGEGECITTSSVSVEDWKEEGIVYTNCDNKWHIGNVYLSLYTFSGLFQLIFCSCPCCRLLQLTVELYLLKRFSLSPTTTKRARFLIV